jgi:fatty-acyl-CoA synthase
MRRAPTDGGLGLRLVVERAAREFPDQRVVTRATVGTEAVTYRELEVRIRSLASALSRLGIGQGDRVASFAWNSHRHLELMLAVPCLGAVLETINVRFTAEEINHLIERTHPVALFIDATLLQSAPHSPADITVVQMPDSDGVEGDGLNYEELLAGNGESFVFPEVDELLPATVCFTSSTTGKPKAVQYSHRSLVLGSLVLNQPSVTPLRETDRVLPIVPLFHANAWGIPFAAMLSGAGLVLPGPRPSGSDLVQLIATERVTKAAGVPAVFEKLLDVADADLSSLEEVYCAGSPPSDRLVRAFKQRHGVDVVHAWGMTETGFFGFVSRPPQDEELSAEGLAELAAAQGRAVPLLESRLAFDGELHVRGPAVAGAYVDELHASAYTPDGWLRTGDLATMLRERYVKLVDRLEDSIKSGGEWIHSLALETLMSEFDGIAEAAVVARPDERWGERPYAFVILGPGTQLDPKLLHDFLAADLPHWWIPDVVEVVDRLPRTGNGKVDKRALRTSLLENRSATRFKLRAGDVESVAR